MRTGNAPDRTGPEGLFAALAEPRLAFFRQSLMQAPLRASLLFMAATVVLTLFLALVQVRAEDQGAVVDLLPSESVFAILLGMAVFPRRLVYVPIVAYAIGFTLAFLLRLQLEADYLPAGQGAMSFLFWAMVLNAIPAVLAGLVGHAVAARWAKGGLRYDLVLSLSTTGAYILFAGLVVAGVLSLLYDPAWDVPSAGTLTALEVGLFRMVRIALCGAVLTLVLLDRPNRRNLRVAQLVLPAFVVLGVLRVMGYSVHPTLDVELLALAVTLLAPVYAAILAVVIGVIAYVAITGEFLVQIPVTSPDVLRLEVISLLLLALIYVLLLQRHQATTDRRESLATIARMVRVHALSTIGHFVVNTDTGATQVDEVGAQMLGMPTRFDMKDLLERVAPADRPDMELAMSDRTSLTRTLTFLLAEAKVWQGDAEKKYLSVHAAYDRQSGDRRFAYGTVIDLTADHVREEALAKALAHLSEQQDRQTRMFSIVSHELRTPASVISMLVDELEGGARWEDMGPRLRAVSEQLLSVLADMRQAVRPMENLPVRMEPFRPKDLAETVRNTFLLMAEPNGIKVDLVLSPEAGLLRLSDRVRLMQALSNLVKNAILHAGCQRITVSYSEMSDAAGDWGLWQVSDDGKGISDAMQAHLFEAFRQGEGSRTAQVDGSGLGLYVTKSSIELLGGTVQHRRGDAGGSVFCLSVLLAEPPPQEAVVGLTAEQVADKAAVWRSRRVLIVEDSDLIGELLVARFRRVFGHVEWVRNGVEALAAYEAFQPDVVLTDLFMPEMGGDDLTSLLRTRGGTCPIIGMTAAAIGDERTRFEQAGTDRVLTKPVSTGQFLDVLEELDRIRG
jgi:two-component system, sensor histidine kinase